MHWYISQFPMWVISWNKIWKRAFLFTKSLKLLRFNVIVIMALPNFTCFWDSSTNRLLHPVLFGLHGGQSAHDRKFDIFLWLPHPVILFWFPWAQSAPTCVIIINALPNVMWIWNFDIPKLLQPASYLWVRSMRIWILVIEALLNFMYICECCIQLFRFLFSVGAKCACLRYSDRSIT